MLKFFSKFSILKASKIEKFGVKFFQKITFGRNFTLKKWFLGGLVPKKIHLKIPINFGQIFVYILAYK